MPEHELEKLLGGFAADTLTEEERKLLFHAALDDQQLFNALADEQAMKELLADPAVRRRLLQALAHHRGAGRGQSWLNRFMQPAGLAWAGGIAVGVFAVVLGLREYQESLRQASETAVLEEVGTSVPSTPPPASIPEQAPPQNTGVETPKAGPLAKPSTKDGLQKSSDSDLERAERRTGTRSDELKAKESQKMDAPIGALGKSSEHPSSSSNERPRPPAALVKPESDDVVQLHAEEAVRVSARTLFYGEDLPSQTIDSAARKKEADQSMKAEPELFTLPQRAHESSGAAKPLALRYGFVIQGVEGDKREMERTGTARRDGTITLRVESNQHAYLQVWTRTGDSLPELALPAKETGRISLKIAEGQRQEIVVPPSSDRLTIRLSRVPFGPITRQEAVMAGRGSVGQLSESVTDEQATYVANSDASTAELAVEIPLQSNAP
jgi:hypothetical protein